MATPSIYINLEDDVGKIVTRLKHQSSKQIVLVCPKRCFLFNDSINLRLLKKQVDLLNKEVFILTMDEKGQMYAKEAGFGLKFLPKTRPSSSFSDVSFQRKDVASKIEKQEPEENIFSGAVEEIKQVAKKISPAKIFPENIFSAQPKVIASETGYPPEVKVSENLFPSEVKHKLLHEEHKGRSRKVFTGITVIIIIAVLALNFLVLPKATVAVFPKTEPVTRDMEISMSVNFKTADSSKLYLPASKIEETINLSEKFQSQGKKQVGNKSAGTIKIYNFTNLPINLKSSTTVLTAGNKTYTLINDISGIKPAVYKNAQTKEVDEASLGESIQIAATSGGEDFNLPAGTRLEITNQVFGSKPQFLFAKSDTEISGGTTRYLSVIAQEDIDNAKNELMKKAIYEINNKLKAQGLFLAENAYTSDVSQFTTDNAVGTQTPNFFSSMEVKINGLAYNEKELESLISERIGQTLSSNKTLEFDAEKPLSVKVKNLDTTNGLCTLNIHFEGQAVFNVDLANITPQLVAKNQNEVYEILRSKAEIEKVEITLAPSWQSNFPLFASRINLIIQGENK